MINTNDKIENVINAFSNHNQKCYDHLFEICNLSDLNIDPASEEANQLVLNLEDAIRQSLINKFIINKGDEYAFRDQITIN